jgi:hypothetical protein
LLINTEAKKTNKRSRICAQHKYSKRIFLHTPDTHVEVAGEVHQMSLNNYANNPLWQILVDTVHTLTMFTHHKAYVRDVVLVEQPQVGAEDLALRLNISLGESLVLLYELQKSIVENQKGLNDLKR